MTRVHKRVYYFFPPVAGNRNPFTPAHVRRGLCQPASKANIQFCWPETISQVFYQQNWVCLGTGNYNLGNALHSNEQASGENKGEEHSFIEGRSSWRKSIGGNLGA